MFVEFLKCPSPCLSHGSCMAMQGSCNGDGVLDGLVHWTPLISGLIVFLGAS